MKTTELIKELQWSLEKHGDCEVLIRFDKWDLEIDYNVNSICITKPTTFIIRSDVDEERYEKIFNDMNEYFRRRKCTQS